MGSNHISAKKGEIAESILLPGDPLRAKFIAETFLDNAECFNEIRGMYGYTGTYKGVPLSVMGTGMGMPSMGIYSYELINYYGVKNLVRVGTAGGFSPNLKCRDLLLAMSVSTDSNYAHTYCVNGTLTPCCDYDLMIKAKETADRLNLKLTGGNVLSSDVFYEEEDNWWEKWSEVGVLGVEMEAAALYMNAARHGAKALAIMTISNDFITGEETTAEERQSTFTDMITLACEMFV